MLANYQIEQSGDIARAYIDFVMQCVTPSQRLFGFILAEVELFCVGLGKQAQVSVGSGNVLDVKPIFLDLGPFCRMRFHRAWQRKHSFRPAASGISGLGLGRAVRCSSRASERSLAEWLQ